MPGDAQTYTNIALLMDAIVNTMLLYVVYNLIVSCCGDTWQ